MSAQWQAMQQQGDLSEFLNDSVAVALFQPTGDTTTGASANTLVDNMLQQVLGAYQAPSAGPTTGATSISG